MRAHVIAFADVLLDPTTGELRRGDRIIPLEPLPTRVLGVLVARAGHLVTRAQLIELAWPPQHDVSDRSLNTCIREIRNALGDDADRPRFIETVPRRGYRFIAAVTAPAPPPQVAVRRRTVLGTAAVAAGLVVALLGWSVFRSPAPVRLMVLPFAAIDSLSGTSYEASMLTEAVLSSLGRLPLDRLRVLGRTTAEHFARTGLSAGAIGDSLALDFLVEGTVRRDAAGLHTVVRIVRVSDESLLWSREFRGESDGLAGVVPALLGRVAAIASVDRSPARLTPEVGAPPDSLAAAAWRAVLKGRYLLRTPGSNHRAAAAGYFREALALDTASAAAHAGLAEVALFDGRPTEAQREAQAALRGDPESAEAHAIMGLVRMIVDWRWGEAADHLARAVALAPGDQRPLHAQAFYFLVTGQAARAVGTLELVHELDPMSAVVAADLGLAFYWVGRYDRASRYCAEAAELEPHASWAYGCLFQSALEVGDSPAAARAVTRLATLEDSTLPLRLADSTITGLRRSYARWYLDGPARSGEHRVAAALAYADLGLVDSAVAALDESARRREPGVVMVGVEPRTRPLRTDVRFRALLDRMGLGDVTPARRAGA